MLHNRLHSLGLLATFVVVALSGCAVATAPATPTPSASATLRVRVGQSTPPGAPPTQTPPGPTPTASSPVPTATPDPFYNVTVRVVQADTPTTVVGEVHSDALGLAVFTLTPGHYWVYVPSDDPAAEEFCGPAAGRGMCGLTSLPDSHAVYAYQDTTLAKGQTVTVALAITNFAAP